MIWVEMVRKEVVLEDSEARIWEGEASKGEAERRELGVDGRPGEGVSSLKEKREEEGVRGGVWVVGEVEEVDQGLGRRV